MTIPALLIGREGSRGFPGKNTYPVLGRPMMAYPLIAAKSSKLADCVYVSTDSKRMMDIGREYGAKIIERPPELCTDEALCEDAFAHGYRVIKNQEANVEMIVLLLANVATVTGSLIDEGIELLRRDPSLDSANTVSKYNMWSPLRARRLNVHGCLDPFVPVEAFGDPRTLSCDRDSQGDVYFTDLGVSIVRPRCFENLHDGLLPQRWMGRRIAPIQNWGGLDVDYKWQVPQVEYWLRDHGFQVPDGG